MSARDVAARVSPDDVDPLQCMTPQEVALILRVSTSTVYRMILIGQLPAVDIGGHIRIRLSEFMAFLEGAA